MNEEISNFVREVKDSLDLKAYISSFGFEANQSGKICCPFHGEKTPSLMIYPTHFKCFGGSCGVHGDFIDFFMLLNPSASFLEALNAGAEFVGRDPVVLGDYSSEAMQEIIDRMHERKKVYAIYEAAATFYCSTLQEPEQDWVIKFAAEKWGFEREFLADRLVGYAPSEPGALRSYLNAKGFSDSEILTSGLFYNGKYGPFEIFRDRVIFPYMVGGLPRYFIGRLPRSAGDDERLNNKPRPKYQKLLVHDPSKHDYVSKEVQNCYLFGEDVLHNKKEKDVIITEGITDAMIGEKFGFPMVSPVTVRLRRKDLERYIRLFKSKRTIYIANDNETNQSGTKGALDIARYLEQNECFVRIISLPREEGSDKSDLNDVLKHSPDAHATMRELQSHSVTPLAFLIRGINPELDDMERNRQVVELGDWWSRVKPVDIPVYVKIIKEHFGLKTAEATAMQQQIKQIIKNEQNKATIQKQKNEASTRTDWSIQEVIEDMFQNPTPGRLANEVGERIFQELQKKGAQFYSSKAEGQGIIYFRNKLYPCKSDNFKQLMFELGKISKESGLGRQIFDYVNQRTIQVGHNIDMFAWIYTTPKELRKYLNISGTEESEIVCLDPEVDQPYTVANGKNKDHVILANPNNTLEFKYCPDADISTTFQLLDKYIFRNFSCNVYDKYLILSWVFNVFFVDKLGTRPHLRLEGSASSGKTTAAKMLTALLYGKPSHQNASTMAAIYELSRSNPLVCLDNIENKDLTGDLLDFIVATATKANRSKKGGASEGHIIQQEPHCMVMTTGIESLSKTELIQRSLIIEFDKIHRTRGFNEEMTLDMIIANRDYILSGMLKVARKMYSTLTKYDRVKQIQNIISKAFPDNPKDRNSSALAYMAIANRIICQHIRYDFDFREYHNFTEFENHIVRFDGNPRAHIDVFKSWIATQTAEDREVSSESSEILYFLNRLKNIWDAAEWSENEFLAEHLVKPNILDNNVFSFLCTSSQLHGAMSKLAKNEGVRYPYTSARQLARRISDCQRTLVDCGWHWSKNVRKDSKGDRYHAFTKVTGRDDIRVIDKNYYTYDEE